MAGKREYLLLFVVTCFMISSYSKSFANQFGYNWQLIQQWLPSVCISKSAFKTPCLEAYSDENKFTISSFIPVDWRGYQIPFCVPFAPPYQSNAIETERPELEEYWPNVFEKDNEKLWKTEWEKKGACAFPELNQTEYFKKALELRKNPDYDLYSIISKTPIAIMANTVEFAKAILERFLTKKPGLRCSEKDGINLLSEIVLCFEGEKFEIKDCPDHVDKCTDPFYFPKGLPFPSIINDH